MKQEIQQGLEAAVRIYLEQCNYSPELANNIELERVKDDRFGDFASNIAMTLAKSVKKNPREVAQGIIKHLTLGSLVEKVEMAGPGFINFTLHRQAYYSVVPQIMSAKKDFGRVDIGKGRKVLVEFVSSNPTGPIHIGHGRGAAYGAALSNLLEAAGFAITREYYVNDAGRQMDILVISVWLRYLEVVHTDEVAFPANGYQGDYIKDIAVKLHTSDKNKYKVERHEISTHIRQEVDQEKQIDNLISFCKSTLGKSRYQELFAFTLGHILNEIRIDLREFGVEFDNWFSERSLLDKDLINQLVDKLRSDNYVYEKDGALWFRSTDFGDEKDRVVIRENGQPTYFASDIAYHINKYERGFDVIIDIWGADHHGYIARVKGALTALGMDTRKLLVLLVQFATLYRGTEKLQMSTRSGEYVTLRQLRDEVGNDATRFFYVLRKSEQHLDFDLQLAKSQTNENPVYYVQYAHARISSVYRQMEDRGLEFGSKQACKSLEILDHELEISLLKSLARYPEIIQAAAMNYEPHAVAFYLRELANHFHAYYNSCQFLVDDIALRNARLSLITATRQVIRNGLEILGVNSPEEM